MQGSLKRGGGQRRESADRDALLAGGHAQEVLALHGALEQLAAHDPVKAKLVELRFFAGLTLDQAAECLGIAPRTADRAWRYARAWLYAAMAGPDSGEKLRAGGAFRASTSHRGVLRACLGLWILHGPCSVEVWCDRFRVGSGGVLLMRRTIMTTQGCRSRW